MTQTDTNFSEARQAGTTNQVVSTPASCASVTIHAAADPSPADRGETVPDVPVTGPGAVSDLASESLDPTNEQVGSGDSSLVSILLEGGVGLPPDEWRIQEANRRQQILDTYFEMVKPAAEGGQGKSNAQAAREIGLDYSTIFRWLQRYRKDGYNGLMPETANCGRKTSWEKLNFTGEQQARIIAELQGIYADTKSVTGALRIYASRDICPPALAELILDPNRSSKHALPPSIREAVKLPKPVHDAHQGPRTLALKGMSTPRKLDILPGDVFTGDDTTPIYAWWVPWRVDKDHPFGVKVLQGQFIPVMDVASQCIISYVIIAREKGSYRASDIWALFGHTFDTVGLPRIGFQLERGSWEANIIRGQAVEYQENEVSYERRVGGLRQLPTNITQWHRDNIEVPLPKTLQTFTSFLPKSKSIEAWFHRSQRLEGMLWGSLGRDQRRVPFEKTLKIFQACQRGVMDPRLHFLSGEELVKRLNGFITWLNNEPMEGEVFKGIPAQKFELGVREYPLFRLPEDKAWLYRREWSVVDITQGNVRVRLTDPISQERFSLWYTNAAVFAQHEGESVAVYYDRQNYEQPAQIVLAKTGEFLCEAPYFEPPGMFFGGGSDGHEARKQWRNAVMSFYTTIAKHAPSRQMPPEIAQRRIESKMVAMTPTIQTKADGTTQVVQARPKNPFAAPTPEEFKKKRALLAQSAAISRNFRKE